MLKQLRDGFIHYMVARCRRTPAHHYGVSVTETSADGKDLFLTFTFRSGHRYCCSAASCHHGLVFKSDFEQLQEYFEKAGAKVSRPMRIHMRVICEGGALFAENPGDAQPVYEAVAKQLEHVELYDESAAPQ